MKLLLLLLAFAGCTGLEILQPMRATDPQWTRIKAPNPSPPEPPDGGTDISSDAAGP